MISIDALCEECGCRYIYTLERNEATYEARWPCTACDSDESVKRVPSAPPILRASYHMGKKRPELEKLKQADSLREEISGLSNEDRVTVEKEINKLEGRK